MSRKKVADIIVDTLAQAGVKRCYGVVGDTLNYITDAIRRSDIDWVHVRHEEAGAFAAGAEASLTGQLTACAGACGPGSLHFINGIYEAHRNRAPVVLIATQIATGQIGMDFPQEVDLQTIYKTCSYFCCYIHSPEQARRVTALAAQAAINKRGVAVIIVSGDMSNMEVEDRLDFRPHHPQPVIRPSNAELQAAADLINAGKGVAIYAGAGCEGAGPLVVALADKIKAPVAHTSRAKDFIEPDNPYNMGMTGVFGVESGFHALLACDTLLLLGTDFAWPQFYPGRAKIIQLDCDATHLGRRHPIDLGLVGDVRETIEALLSLLTAREENKFLDRCRAYQERTLQNLAKQERAGRRGIIHPQHLVKTIDQLAGDDAAVTADAGGPLVWMLRHFSINGRRRTLTSLLHATMANAMPQAIGIQKAYPDRQVIALCGDGGLAMLMGDLLTLVQEKLPVKIAVFNNESLGFVELEQKVEGLLDAFTGLTNPDFGKVAEAIGFYGRRVEHTDELQDAVTDWLAQPGPALLDVKVNRFELVMPPDVQFAQVLHTGLYSVKAILTGRGDDVLDLVRSNFTD
ncbi:thiamine pyrophosphate-dependent enzyme [Phyllobacterium leguminum]|uniref:Pyruvate dehydrogenase (Quinone) n=1 Tax=Phyllobacterium leguminum TaxID=314237 RepID=A0A318T0L2_9HYPH|nr:thiamine pyrophosphate-dependent enzyme [Phyllobacterium leguminum]PYE87834.1 pyruvate dehydrogenase (quinone) [Phyllobacterium leguminum]